MVSECVDLTTEGTASDHWTRTTATRGPTCQNITMDDTKDHKHQQFHGRFKEGCSFTASLIFISGGICDQMDVLTQRGADTSLVDH